MLVKKLLKLCLCNLFFFLSSYFFFNAKATVQVYARCVHRQYSHKAGDVPFSSGNKMLFLCNWHTMFLYGMYLHVAKSVAWL